MQGGLSWREMSMEGSKGRYDMKGGGEGREAGSGGRVRTRGVGWVGA